MAKKVKRTSPDPTDIYVGSRVRMQRLLNKMTQDKLGYLIGVTFQQVQKYEKGTNRISASRLQQIATVFKISSAFFFEGVPTTPGEKRRGEPVASYVSDFLATIEGLELIKAFIRIKDKELRWALVALIDRIAPEKD